MTRVRFLYKGKPVRKNIFEIANIRFNIEGVTIVCKEDKLFRESDGYEIGAIRVDRFSKHAVIGIIPWSNFKIPSIDIAV